MKSKAQQYADAIEHSVNMKPKSHKQARVLDSGRLDLFAGNLGPSEALALRDWLTDTFDTPVEVWAVCVDKRAGIYITSTDKEYLDKRYPRVEVIKLREVTDDN